MSIVSYGHHQVSDKRLRDALERMADETSRVVKVTSGDRNFVPRGGSHKSLHLMNEAVDFHIEGLSDEQAFTLIRLKRKAIFGTEEKAAFRFQIIWHGAYTETQGGHLHLGYAPVGTEAVARGFLVEGTTPASKGRYERVEFP